MRLDQGVAQQVRVTHTEEEEQEEKKKKKKKKKYLCHSCVVSTVQDATRSGQSHVTETIGMLHSQQACYIYICQREQACYIHNRHATFTSDRDNRHATFTTALVSQGMRHQRHGVCSVDISSDTSSVDISSGT